MSNQEKPNKLREIKESVAGVVEILRQVRTPGALEAFDKVMDTSFAVKEIFEALKSPEMVKNIENFRMISENFNEASARMQNTVRHLEETGVIGESVKIAKSVKGAIEFVDDAKKDFHDISSSIKEVFCSVRAAQDKIQAASVRYRKDRNSGGPAAVPDEMVITPDETEHYLRLGWKYLAVLPNGKVVVKRLPMEGTVGTGTQEYYVL